MSNLGKNNGIDLISLLDHTTTLTIFACGEIFSTMNTMNNILHNSYTKCPMKHTPEV